MNNHLQKLKVVLQTLGLPTSGQVQLMQHDCSRIAILAEAFAIAHQAVRAQADTALTPAQITVLTELDNQLAKVWQKSRSPLCSELAMRQNAEWRQVRTMAREALIRFWWTLDFPPHERYPEIEWEYQA